MKKSLLILFLISNLQLLTSKADNTGQINGTVTDSISGETLIGATIQVMLSGKSFGTTTDIEGYYALKPLEPGMYDVKVSFIGYEEKVFKNVRVSQQSITVLNAKLATGNGIVFDDVIFTEYRDLISIEPKTIFTADVIQDMPVRKVDDIVSLSAGVYQSDGGELYFRGSRPEATEYYVDNVKIIGDHNVPAGAIAEIMVYSGGIPARYGDVTGGVVVITTKSHNMYHGE
jgi:hypothetical protein